MGSQCAAVLLAAGHSSRMGIGANKAYLEIAGRSLLSYSLAALSASPWIDEIVLVVGPGEEALAARTSKDSGKTLRIIAGGERRQDSSLVGVRAASREFVLIHDAARPFPSLALIRRVIKGVWEHGACVPVLPVVDTLRYRDRSGFFSFSDLTREDLHSVQTPQGFQRVLIERCLEEGKGDEHTDDAAAVLARGVAVWTVAGEATNIKLTTREDLELATAVATFLEREGRL
jgi:2-C-methyl-D-erythritol 4-phosphate cytidylyltransferase